MMTMTDFPLLQPNSTVVTAEVGDRVITAGGASGIVNEVINTDGVITYRIYVAGQGMGIYDVVYKPLY